MVQHTIAAIVRAPIVIHPFPYVFVEGVFREDLFRCILKKLPRPELTEALYKDKLKYRDPGRNFLKLIPESIHTALDTDFDDDFWVKFTEMFSSQKLIDVYLDKFDEVLKKRFPYNEHLFGFENYLVRDVAGYTIGPHCDKPTKILTTVYYLKSDMSRRAGTSLYTSHSAASKVDELNFKPNSLFSFAPCTSSWHGVEVQQNISLRETIQGFVYCKSCDFSKGGKKRDGFIPLASC